MLISIQDETFWLKINACNLLVGKFKASPLAGNLFLEAYQNYMYWYLYYSNSVTSLMKSTFLNMIFFILCSTRACIARIFTEHVDLCIVY